jgi:rubredoxin
MTNIDIANKYANVAITSTRDEIAALILRAADELKSNIPVPMILTCPVCGERHIDVGEFATKLHHTHACQFCGLVWRPALVPTFGVRFLPGFKNE